MHESRTEMQFLLLFSKLSNGLLAAVVVAADIVFSFLLKLELLLVVPLIFFFFLCSKYLKMNNFPHCMQQRKFFFLQKFRIKEEEERTRSCIFM